MRDTRSSARKASGSTSNSSPSNASAAGTKRKSETSPSSNAKRGKKGEGMQQMTLEETLQDKQEDETAKDVQLEQVEEYDNNIESPSKSENDDAKDSIEQREEAVKAREDAVKEKEKAAINGASEDKSTKSIKQELQDKTVQEKDASSKKQNSTTNGLSKMDDTGEIVPDDKFTSAEERPSLNEGDAVEESSQREQTTPSSILEKGIIYFFFRGRVGIDEPSDIGDLARSYMVLRPLPHGAKLGDGPIGDAGTNRLLALPKKVLPVSPRDRFMVFVEKAKCSMEDIKQNLGPSDYVTQTAGARHTPAATPIAEGVYAITSTGRESHLAYILTIPSELSEVQRDVGLRERGSFVTSVKNPQYAGPANTNLPQGPDFPQE